MADRGRKLDDDTRDRIAALKRKALGIKAIARRLGISRNTARKYFHKPIAV